MSSTSYDGSHACDTDSLIPQPGFGFEFDTLLEQRLSYHENQADARFKKYGRFGMTREESLRATPEDYRQQYDDLLNDVLMEDTPPTSPSPSPPRTWKQRAIKNTREPARHKMSYIKKCHSIHSSNTKEGRQGGTKEGRQGRTKEGRQGRRGRRKTSSLHGMETRLKRSRKQAHTRSRFQALPY
jgi:hypothetical protein